MKVHCTTSFLVLGAAILFLAFAPIQASQREAERREALILLHDELPAITASSAIRDLGGMLWMQINQDAQSYKSGVIDVRAVMQDVDAQCAGRIPPWGVLDFEEPFFKLLEMSPDAPERQRALQSMLSALRVAKQRYPGVRWSFYGLPNLPFWVDGKGWADLSPTQQADAIRKGEVACRDLVAEADWITVSVYDYYDPQMVIPGSPTSLRQTPDEVVRNGSVWRMAQVGLAKQLAAGKPTIAMVCPFWAPGGIAPTCELIPIHDFVERQIRPCLRAGASGFALFAGYPYRIVLVSTINQLDPTKERGFGREDWRRAFVRDVFDGNAPQDWADPAVKSALQRSCSRWIIERLQAIRTLADELPSDVKSPKSNTSARP